MIDYFKKLDFKLTDIDMSRIAGGPLYEGYGPSLKGYSILDIEYLNSIVSQYIKFNIPPELVSYTEIGDLGTYLPHTDYPMTTALNYYLDTVGGVTVFWKLKDTNTQPSFVDRLLEDGTWDHAKAQHVQRKDVVKVCEFKAGTHEPWLLNVGQYHTVVKTKPDVPRTMIRWLWSGVTFQQVLDSIEILEGGPDGKAAVC